VPGTVVPIPQRNVQVDQDEADDATSPTVIPIGARR
jgi:hypothetical protein